MKTRLRFTIDFAVETTDVQGEPQELTDAEIETLRERFLEQASVMGCTLRPLGRGKGYALYVLPERESVRVNYVEDQEVTSC